MTLQPNLLVHADALAVLERMDAETIDLFYLDPPWPRSFEAADPDKQAYKDLIYKTLQQANRILTPTGNLFFYSRPDLNLDLTPLLTDVFGAENFVAEFVVPYPSYRQVLSDYWPSHETILFYKRSEIHVQNRAYAAIDGDVSKLFPNQDKNGRYRHHPAFGPTSDSRLSFSWRDIAPPKGMGWRFSREKLEEYAAKQELLINDRKMVYVKKYMDEASMLRPVGTIWADVAQSNEKQSFPTQQNLPLLERIIHIGSHPKQTICDPFCGSGTAIVAAIRMGRKFIACDMNPEAIETCQQRIAHAETAIAYAVFSQQDITQRPIVWNSYRSHSWQEEEEVLNVLLQGETATVEFKESACWDYRTNRKDPALIDKITRTIAAFMNSFGGKLFIGVKNDGALQDLQLDYDAADPGKKDRDGYELFLSHKINQKLSASSLHRYRIQFFTLNQCEICQIEVESSKEIVFWNEECYVRVNNQSKPLNAEQFFSYLKNKGMVTA